MLENTLHRDITYHPPKSTAIYTPMSLLFVILAIPFLYAGINILILTPHISSLDHITSDSTKTRDSSSSMASNDSLKDDDGE